MNRINYEVSELLAGIPGSPDEVGYDVSVSKIYDDIKNAKFDEDSSVSFGIWERELKKADWELTEKLAVDALKTKSKDFQIVGWLIEALVTLDSFSGIAKGIDILAKFSNAFWQTGYPRKEDNSSDTEQKLRICEWIFDVVARKSKLIPIIDGDSSVNLYQYEYALDLKNAIIRSQNSSSEILENAQKSGHSTIEEIENKIKTMPREESTKTLEDIQMIKDEKSKLDKALLTLSGKTLNSFSELVNNLNKIKKLINHPSTETSDNMEPKKNISLSNRDAIYNSIASLSKQLSDIEKHSPSSFILNLVVSWKDKNLLEIMDDLKTGNSEAHKLLKFLIN